MLVIEECREQLQHCASVPTAETCCTCRAAQTAIYYFTLYEEEFARATLMTARVKSLTTAASDDDVVGHPV